MPMLSFGPFDLKLTTDDSNHTRIRASFWSARGGGLAQRESAIELAGKSEHALAVVGQENPSDTETVDGVTYVGRIQRGFDGKDYVLSAKQVAASAIRSQALREGKRKAERIGFELNGDAAA